MLCRLLRLLRDMHSHTVELFRVLFYQPRFMSSDVEDLWKSAMADAHRYIHNKLCEFGGYVDVIANSSMCSPSYLFHAFEHLHLLHNFLISNRQHLFSDTCLEDKTEDYQELFSAVWCTTIVHGHKHTHMSCWGYRGGVPTADRHRRPCCLWEPTPSHPRFLM